VVYFCNELLATRGESIAGKAVLISGCGNVAQFAARKCIALGARVLTMSDSSGYVLDTNGITMDKLDWIMELKNTRRGRLSEYAEHFGGEGSGVEYHAGAKSWGAAATLPVDVAMPCATQNELSGPDAEMLVQGGCSCVCEGANMPSTPETVRYLQLPGLNMLYSPGKASNAGGVAISAIEMAQNSQRMNWTCEEVDAKLHVIMRDIHASCTKYGMDANGVVDYVKGMLCEFDFLLSHLTSRRCVRCQSCRFCEGRRCHVRAGLHLSQQLEISYSRAKKKPD
jgi:glutamate dehydrogenase (NADP+)